MTRPKHCQDVVSAVLGAWLIASPWAVGYQNQTAAMVDAIAVGVVLITAALGAILVQRAWEEWTEGLLGLWLFVSLAVLGFTASRGALLSAVATGIVIVALAIWTLLTDKDYSAWLRKRAAH